MLGGKWEDMRRWFSFSFSFHWSPSIGTFQGSPNIGTFHWPPSWDLPSHFSFSFSLKCKFKSFGAFFSRHNFQFESWKYLFIQLSLGWKEWFVLIDGGKKENILDGCSTFERMEVNRDNVGSLKSYINFTNTLRSDSTTSH